MAANDSASFVVEEAEDDTLERVEDERDRALGRYQLCYHVASGGMASVFLARALGPGGFHRPVAIKRIHPHLARRKEFVAMFLDEARIASRINHPNVCGIHDFGEIDGAYFIAMEYLVGVSLTRLMNTLSKAVLPSEPSRLDDPQWHALAARIIADAAEGLHAAHELRDEGGVPLGIVHRDVSPQNVFVTFDGAVKVLDFGIALARDRLQQTSTGTLKGKLGYMAPEQSGTSPVDRRADVWALGVCLWEMLVGRRLFKRDGAMETLRAVSSEAIPAPSSLRPTVPEALDAIVLRALERDAAARQPTARALARELEAFVRTSGRPTGLSDLDAWMEPLFGEERHHKTDVVRTMLEVHEVSTHVKPRRRGAAAAAGDEARVGAETASFRPEGSAALDAPVATEVDVAPDGARPHPTRRTWIAAGVGAVALLVAASAIVAVAVDDAEPAPTRTGGRQPTTSTTTTPTPDPPTPIAEPRPSTTIPTPSTTAAAPEEPATPEPAATPRSTKRPRARARTADPAAPALGDVTIAATGGWAEVYESGRLLGQTPTRVRLRAGRHTLVLKPFGRDPVRRITVDVRADRLTPVVVPLSR